MISRQMSYRRLASWGSDTGPDDAEPSFEGEIREMTGVDDPYEIPEHPLIRADAVKYTPEEAARYVLLELDRVGWATHR